MNDTDASEASEALRFLRHNLIAAVSTASADGRPQVAFVYFLTDDDFTVYFMTRKDSRKFRNIESNQRLSLAVADPGEMKTVQMDGDVEVVTDVGEVGRFTHMLMRNWELYERYQGKAPMKFLPPDNPSGSDDQYALLRMRPTWLRWMRPNAATGDPEFLQLLPEKQ